MKSKALEAILISKVGNKKLSGAKTGPIGGDVPSADELPEDRDFRGIKDGIKDSGPFPTANKTGSLDIIKAAKLTSKPVMKTDTIPEDAEAQVEGEVSLGPTSVQPYSPVKNYLMKKKGK